MSRPVVGVTPNHFDADRTGAPNPEGSFYLNRPYVDALRKAGAVPLVLPYLPPGPEIEAVLERLDGLVMTGGFDVAMDELGVPLHPRAGRVHPERLHFELDLCRRSVARDLPFLGICLGLQHLNLAFGGGLDQHIPDSSDGSIDHGRAESTRSQPVHPVALAEGSLLREIMGAAEIQVNSLHHQAPGEPGEGIRVVGRAPDGVVEAMERPESRFCLGVQWHPEELPEHLPIFQAFVRACVEGRGRQRRIA